jgi:hypothetical protein
MEWFELYRYGIKYEGDASRAPENKSSTDG